ncbi:MAG: indole-3-glycerol-phosphate synthase [Candidatus Melainabacteria bacterium]
MTQPVSQPDIPAGTTSVLQTILAHKRLEVADRKNRQSLAQLRKQLAAHPAGLSFPFEAALQGATATRPKAILEIKPASPSAGELTSALDLPGILAAYNQFGSALSVLTDTAYFKGSLDLLRAVRAQSSLPILCKDFILDPYQLVEARLAGADAALLIVKGLNDDTLASLHREALALGLTPVVEIQDEDELNRAVNSAGIQPRVLLINNRNLDTLAMDMTTTARLAPLCPASVLTVAASGYNTREELDAVAPVCPRFLIGSALMQTPVAELPERLGGLLR